MRSAKKLHVGVKPVQWFSTAQKLAKRRLKRKVGPSAVRRKTKRLSLQKVEEPPISTETL